ncbi:hypothetical protein SYNTR_1260 [Candidatus Syntrophocurvum alkaliphilum]|uniref:Nif11 domain-containing protein n=1 Tax=Candidatus Syntrophocurvum alkaliphilum TaxID=2293317 RepID=A0A6I6DHV9_9FIRM|nr:Nif11-like leader peptide family RiPP precursor [Candidatus Syntrophocurvum alkaliphilum]QGT99853.1 hypothetical protein SYNTR_1260 [Candidatus Syntrophocurvum alkaliphilum]
MADKIKQVIDKINNDQEFKDKIFSLESAEEVQAVLKEEGFDLTVDEILQARDAFVKEVEQGELSDESLEDVAGGGDCYGVRLSW